MALTLGMITIDSADPGPLARWWAELTGGAIEQENDGWFHVVAVPGWGHKLGFQKVDDPTPGKNRLHMDLSAPDLDAEVDRVLAVGGTELYRENMDGFRWVVFADPEGNRFCVSGAH